ncbi:DUF421 domain-containing protein [Desulfosporosinus sp.]|uniref:YetF domain-containing protein n=1 Tax=Desulfosporosinus sp. TaxID=157907 RepID=UPI000E9FBC84|nr:DUF421 domain-containing protein [Desulfosporosinus sp.]MBC2725066.1 DUF421 domain-containing protein [Desulfosporosinus sp.]HBV86314.1 DUF421 domain-containing protein [Desulfosporosinus sp.]
MDTILVVLRALFAFILLLIVARLMGRKVISQMTFFDFGVAISIGSITANLAMSQGSTTITAVTVLITFGTLSIITGYLHIKSLWFRKLTNSEPVTAIANGQIIDKNLKRLRLTTNELTSLLREKNIFNIADVEFAILENEGKLSVLPKSQKQPLTPSDLNITTVYKGLTADIIIDGNIMQENLRSAKLNEEWLKNQLNSQGISSVQEVFYAGLDSSGNLYVSKKTNNEETEGQYGIE